MGQNPIDVSALVLAGGLSRRMGTDKATLLLDGETLIVRAVRRLATISDDVIVASGDGLRLPVPGTRQVADAAANAGPLGGLVAGLESARHPLVAVVALDMPHANPVLLRALAALWAGESAVVCATEAGLEPLHAVYARTAAPELRARLEGDDRSLHAALEALDARVIAPETWRAWDPGGRFASNLNTPEDLSP